MKKIVIVFKSDAKSKSALCKVIEVNGFIESEIACGFLIGESIAKQRVGDSQNLPKDAKVWVTKETTKPKDKRRKGKKYDKLHIELPQQ